MFYVFCIFTPLFRRFRLSRVSQTIDLEEIYRLVLKILNFSPNGSLLSRYCVFFGGRAALSSGPVTCDTFGPDSSSSSLACGCKSYKMHTTILVKTPHHRACVRIMCHTFLKKAILVIGIFIRCYPSDPPPMVTCPNGGSSFDEKVNPPRPCASKRVEVGPSNKPSKPLETSIRVVANRTGNHFDAFWTTK